MGKTSLIIIIICFLFRNVVICGVERVTSFSNHHVFPVRLMVCTGWQLAVINGNKLIQTGRLYVKLRFAGGAHYGHMAPRLG